MDDDLAPFESPKELIEGAKEGLANLEAACAAFGKDCPYEIVTHLDNKTRETVVRLRLKQRFPPKIRRLASSILKETRLALDQAMCDAAIVLGRKDAKGVYFPLGKSVADLRHSRKDKCKGVDRRIVAYAMKFKPYYGGNPFLWSCARLATHSHQRIVGAQLEDQAGFARALSGIQVGPFTLHINEWSDLNNELTVARIPPGSRIEVRANFILSFKVVFAKSGEAVAGREVTTTLHEFVRVTEGIVLGLEAETSRLLS